MSRLKRKASQELTRNSFAVSEPKKHLLEIPPVDTMGAIQSYVARAYGFVKSWFMESWYTGSTYTHMSYAEEVRTRDHVQTSHPRDDGAYTLKRQRTRPTRSKSAHSDNRRGNRLILDLDGCRTEAEAEEALDKLWEARRPRLIRKPSTGRKYHTEERALKVDDEEMLLGDEDASSKDLIVAGPCRAPRASFRTEPTRGSSQHTQRSGSFPRYKPRTSRDSGTTSDGELADRMKKLLESSGEQKDSKQFSPSSYAQEKRIKAAKEREKQKRQEAVKAARKRRLMRRRPIEALISPMPMEWERKVEEVRYREHHEVITTSIGGTELHLKDFSTLGPRQWLNDEIINTYIEWIVDAANKAAVEEAKELGEPVSIVPRFIAHNSFFWNNMRKKGPSSTTGLMRRKKAPGDKLLEVDSVFVPICSGNHWTIGVVRPIAKTIEYFDSMGGQYMTKPFVQTMREWLQFQLGDKYIEDEWTVPQTGCAAQNNGFDCGVFVCTNAFCVALGLDTSCYIEHDMTQQRRNIAALLINRGFHGDFAWNKVGL
ncbi:hypothetical protein BGZ60DRAFT_398058 [Tricladium varicosporioides]|nr:hypothetical protein BGZ60DRAFT_398058 [Hymenoscyphus varicosporioides]